MTMVEQAPWVWYECPRCRARVSSRDPRGAVGHRCPKANLGWVEFVRDAFRGGQ